MAGELDLTVRVEIFGGGVGFLSLRLFACKRWRVVLDAGAVLRTGSVWSDGTFAIVGRNVHAVLALLVRCFAVSDFLVLVVGLGGCYLVSWIT